MAWDRVWRCKRKSLSKEDVKRAAENVAKEYKDVRVTIDKESDDCTTCFFTVSEEESESIFEISIYDMGKDGFVISLEADASDNQLSDDADQLAEDLADELNALPLEL